VIWVAPKQFGQRAAVNFSMAIRYWWRFKANYRITYSRD
jgi:hypothetical protein